MFSDYDIPQQIVRDVADHEVFISFTNDEDAVMFFEWLSMHGMKSFGKWREKEMNR